MMVHYWPTVRTLCGVLAGLWTNLSLTWILWTAVSGQPDREWTERPVDQLVKLNGTANFTCKPSPVSWTKDTISLFSYGSRFKDTPSRYTLINGNNTLLITGVVESDNGKFGCSVLDLGTVNAQLTVLLPPGIPNIVVSSADRIFQEGQNVQFNCTTTGGNPIPTITWMKNGVELINANYIPASTIGGVSRSIIQMRMDHSDHQANYSCFVYNLFNEGQPLVASQILAVQYAPIVTLQPFSPYVVKLGQRANISCQVDANPNVTSISWEKNGISVSGSDFVRIFPFVAKSDSGNYTCKAANALTPPSNPSRSNVIVMDVVYSPVVTIPTVRNASEFSYLSVECKVDSNPLPYQIMWQKILPDGTMQPVVSTPLLTFTRIRREDAGNYSCKAKSQLKVSGGSGTENVEGEAFMAIYVPYPPGAASISPVADINVGDRLLISCFVIPEGYPSANFRWQKNGVNTSQMVNTFTIAQANLSDGGVYTCTPYNAVGEGTPALINISVNAPPVLSTGLPEKLSIQIIDTRPMSMNCTGQGRPQPSIEWFKDGIPILQLSQPQYFDIVSSSAMKNIYTFEVASTLYFRGPGRELTYSGERTKLRIEDTGNYTCRISSPAHAITSSSTGNLLIEFQPVLVNVTEKVAVMVTNPANLECIVQAYPKPTLQWYCARQQLRSPPYTIQQTSLTDVFWGYKSVLRIDSISPDQFGLYSCFASNYLGNVTLNINITTKSIPEPPTNLQTMERTWESVYLDWDPGFDGGYSQTFQVLVSESGSTVPKKVSVQPPTASAFNVTGLKPSVRYEFAIFGQNLLGEGQRSTVISSQTRELNIPSLDHTLLLFNSATNTLVITRPPESQYCLKIEIKDSDGVWQTVKACAKVLAFDSLQIVNESGISAVNVSICLEYRPDICGSPVSASVSQPDGSPTLSARDVIIIGCVCGVIIITLLIILICFICRRRRAHAKEYENEVSNHPPTTNGGVPGKKPQISAPQSYDNSGMMLHESQDPGGTTTPYNNVPQSTHVNTTNGLSFYGHRPHTSISNDPPPNYWDLNSRHFGNSADSSFDLDLQRQMFENSLNRRNENPYGRADGFRGRQDPSGLHGGTRSPNPDKYIDLEERKDPSVQSQESGYSTGDLSKPKKVIYEVVV